MSALRPFHPCDLFKFNHTNLDPLTETYDLSFYLSYLARWPSLVTVVEGQQGGIDAYLMGKLESSPAHAQNSPHFLPWHAHLTALTVAPASRRLGLASLLTRNLERAGDANDAWFNDLFVRESNKVAQGMYKRMGYSVFRRVVGYYHDSDGVTDGEDGFDMRKPLKRDEKLEHIRANGEDHRVQPHDVW